VHFAKNSQHSLSGIFRPTKSNAHLFLKVFCPNNTAEKERIAFVHFAKNSQHSLSGIFRPAKSNAHLFPKVFCSNNVANKHGKTFGRKIRHT
jgi:hypothetical protein